MDVISFVAAQNARKAARQELLQVMLLQAEMNAGMVQVMAESGQGMMPRPDLVNKVMELNGRIVAILEAWVKEGQA